MPLTAGTRLGPYSIVAPLGAGGMGEVYRARDMRLDRDVAIKVLPELFAADPDRLTRFEREAKALAALSHPHIAHIHEIAELPAGGDTRVAALVMELVEGDDLSVRIARGRLPIEEALPIALQIADALEAAHERGLIHRDLKPANIKVSADGDVKVLDFGLAKAAGVGGAAATAGSELAADPVNSPTMSIAGTRAGIILGTAAYMAPEQARGQAVDRRADIWAFGVVLFEMLSGQQAFAGDTISDVLASVLKNDLDWTKLPQDLPPPILRLLHRCLTPDRRSRLRDMGEARIAIAAYLAGKRDEVTIVPSARPARWRRFGLIGALAAVTTLAAGLIVAVAILGSQRKAPTDPPRRFVVSPPEHVTAYVLGRPSVSIARDGWTVAFTGLEDGVSHIFVRAAGEFDARKLPGTEGGSNPVFSPDGRTLAFLTPTQLKTVGLDGGAPSMLASTNDPRGLAWVDDSTLIYCPESIGGLFEISTRGGAARALTTTDDKAGERTHRWPHALPGGRWILFTVGLTSSPDNYDSARIDAVDRTTGQRRHVFDGASMAGYASTGHLLFARGGSLYAVRFDPATLAVAGEPSVVQKGIGGDFTTGAANAAWTDEGTFAYVPGDARGGMRQLDWTDLKGARQNSGMKPDLYNDVRLSPDGSRVAVGQGASGVADIWVYTFARGTYTRLTFTGVNATPVWSADGRDLFFSALDNNAARSTIFRTSADGGREPVAVTSADERLYLKYVSDDASWALVDYVGSGGARANVGRIALKTDAKVEPIVATRSDEYAGALAPNGRLLAYQSDSDGRPEVYVRTLAASSGRWQISNAGGEEPMWAPDGKSIYYRIEGRLMRVPVIAADPFQTGLPVQVFDGVYNLRSDTGVSYTPHPDGTRLLMTRSADVISAGSVRVMTRWFDELRKIK
jgi:eukaryotic-like serine/threonine-protein kinase